MSMKLRELIRQVRSCKTAAEERAVIAKECAAIRDSFKAGETSYLHRNISKLLFINMMGYPTLFGQMECVKLIASPKFPEKRIGYLGLSQMLDEDTEVLMLVTNSIKQDMASQNQFISGAAITTLGNLGTPEMCTVLAREVEGMLTHANPTIKKKAALCAMRIIAKAEDLTNNFAPKIAALLEDKNHGVVLAGCACLLQLVQFAPSLLPSLRHCGPMLIRCLKTIIVSGYSGSAEYEFSGITDPFLQVYILRLLGVLGAAGVVSAEEMNDLLAQIATNTDGSRNAGNAVLYECVNTIFALPNAENGLRVLGVNILGRFLTNKDNNVRYVALSTLQKIVVVDEKAVQRHRATVLECLQDSDISIRRRALDVATALTNAQNIKAVAKEFLNYLMISEPEFRDDLVSRICHVADRFSPDQRWYVDTIIKVMSISGSYVRDGVLANLCHTLIATPALQAYATVSLLSAARSLDQPQGSDAVLHAAVWCVGEFGGALKVNAAELVEFLDDIARKAALSAADHQAALQQQSSEKQEAWLAQLPSTRSGTTLNEYVVNALVKLSVRLSPDYIPRIIKILQKFDSALSAELQQRACEYLEILKPVWDKHRKGVLDKMPVSEKCMSGLAQREVGEISAADAVLAPARKTATHTASSDLADLLGAPTPVKNGSDALLDILGEIAPDRSAPILDPLGDIFGAAPKPKNVYDKGGLKIEFTTQPTGSKFDVSARFINSGSGALANFMFEVAVPKYLKLTMQPASSSSISAYGSASQSFVIVNTEEGKPVLIKFRLSYSDAFGQSITDLVTLNGL